MTELNSLVILAITLLMAYFVKQVSGKVGLPIVTGYVLTGVVLGISLLNILHVHALQDLDLVNDLALGLIAFTIGSELRRSVFRELGRSILVIAIFEGTVAFALVTGVMLLIDADKLYQALILGAVASATAPAATVYVIQQYKAKGPLATTILAVVGIDDAIALTIFVFASAIVQSILGSTHISAGILFFHACLDIALSLLLGVFTGLIFVRLFGTGAFILLNLGVAGHLHLSGMLSVMTFAAVVSNLNIMLNNRSARILEGFAPVLYACFFIFGGAHLDFALLPKIGWIGLAYLLSRAAGKIGGAGLGAWIGKAPKTIRKYIGFSLLPQVGVAIALAIMVRKEFGQPLYGDAGSELAALVINVLLFTTIITEIIGPFLTKWVLGKAGEIGKE